MPQPPTYPEEAVRPMREELTSVGFKELKSPGEVDQEVSREGTTLVVINSVCGCAAGGARPGVALALQQAVIPDNLATVFAGMERDAVDRVRALHAGYPPSSPSICLFKDGRLVHMLQRSDIEGRDPRTIAEHLAAVFEEHCSRPGPSIPPEQFARLTNAKICGSQIPRLS